MLEDRTLEIVKIFIYSLQVVQIFFYNDEISNGIYNFEKLSFHFYFTNNFNGEDNCTNNIGSIVEEFW